MRQLGREGAYGRYQCVVRDTGIGMSEQFQQHLFAAFERESSGVTTGIEGSCLGLAITKRLVEAMGWTISCESTRERALFFTCTFSFAIGTEADLAGEAQEESHRDMRGKRVLLVEDNALNREISRELLEGEGFVVEGSRGRRRGGGKALAGGTGPVRPGSHGHSDAADGRIYSDETDPKASDPYFLRYRLWR